MKVKYWSKARYRYLAYRGNLDPVNVVSELGGFRRFSLRPYSDCVLHARVASRRRSAVDVMCCVNVVFWF